MSINIMCYLYSQNDVLGPLYDYVSRYLMKVVYDIFIFPNVIYLLFFRDVISIVPTEHDIVLVR